MTTSKFGGIMVVLALMATVTLTEGDLAEGELSDAPVESSTQPKEDNNDH